MNLTPEQEAWLEEQRRKLPANEAVAVKQKPQEPVPVQVLTDDEIAWLWPRFQKCGHGGRGFANSFAKTPLEKLSPRGKACVHSVAYTFRRQIFKGSEKWSLEQFVNSIRLAVACPKEKI